MIRLLSEGKVQRRKKGSWHSQLILFSRLIVHNILQQCIHDRLAILNGSWRTKPLPCASQGQEWCLSTMLGRNQPKRKYTIYTIHAGRGDPSNFFQEGTGYTCTCWVPLLPRSKREGVSKRDFRFASRLNSRLGTWKSLPLPPSLPPSLPLSLCLSLSLSLQPVKSLSNHSILLALLTVHK